MPRLISAALVGLALPVLLALGTAHAAPPGTLERLSRARRAQLAQPWSDWQARVRAASGTASGRSAPRASGGATAHAPRGASGAGVTVTFPPANVRINDAALDSAGVAQIDPTIAALGGSVLCAFTDGQALVRPVGGVGFAWSADGGLSWTDGGAPPAPAGWSWEGRPALAADPGSGLLFLVALADSNVVDPAQAWNALITVAAGFPTPGAPLWGTPRVATRSVGSAGLFDQPALAVDAPTHALELVCVHYTALGSGIEYRASLDQGAGWSAPLTLSSAEESGAVAGPRIVDLPQAPARVSVAWLSAGSAGADAYRVRSSPDGGASWDPAVTATSAFHDFGSGPPGSNRGSATDIPALTVDAAAGSPHFGRLYLAWQESVDWLADTLYFSPPLGAPAAIESASNDDAAHATPFAIGQTLRGSLSAGDQDWFAFAASAGQTVVLAADSLDLGLESSLRLDCTDAATRLAFSQGVAGTGYGGQLVFTIAESGTYFVRLAEPPGSAGAGGYRVRTALHHAAAERARDHRDLFVSHSDDGSAWSAPVLLTDDPPRFDDALPELAVDGNGVAYAEWLDWRDAPAGSCGGVSHTYLARSANGGDVFTSFGAVADAPSAWSAVAANLAPLEGDHLALFANQDAVYPAWTDGRSGDPEIEGVTLGLAYLVTPVAISLVRADVAPAQVTLDWYEAGGLESVTLERRVEPFNWRAIATLEPDGSGFLSYVDRAVAPGAHVHYRLSFVASPEGPWFGEVDVRVPERPSFALDGVWPNPITRAAPVVRFSLDSSAPASLELLDAAGRRLAGEEVGALGAGAHVVALTPRERLAPGVYLLRLTQSGRSRTGRAVVIR
jgi:hypothetical protein